MCHTRFFKRIWFSSVEERIWLETQIEGRYKGIRKSRVLYALRRLSRIFHVGFCELDATKKLFDIFDNANRKKTFLSRMTANFNVHKFQYVFWDFDDANEVMDAHKLPRYILSPETTVLDYVRFIDDYDAKSRRLEGMSVVDVFGL